MAAITAAAVAQLREKTGAGMMECKKALTEAEGDMDAAVTILRKRLGNKVENRQDRAASEGLVLAAVSEDRRIGAIIELNSETDFVARNENFIGLGQALVQKITSFPAGTVPTGLDALLASAHNDKTVGETINDAAAVIGEKIALSRFERFGAPDGNVVAAYVHNPGGAGAQGGKIGVLVELAHADGDPVKMSELAREIALHISSAAPRFLHESEVDASTLDKEREIAAAQISADPKMEGKPQSVIDGAIAGRVQKVLKEMVLHNQAYVRDEKKTITQLLKENGGASIVRFVRFKVGDAQVQTAAPEVETAQGNSN